MKTAKRSGTSASTNKASAAKESSGANTRGVREAELLLQSRQMTDQERHRLRLVQDAEDDAVNLVGIDATEIPEMIINLINTYERDEISNELLWETITDLVTQMGAILKKGAVIGSDEKIEEVDRRIVNVRIQAGVSLVSTYMKLNEAYRQQATYRKVFGGHERD